MGAVRGVLVGSLGLSMLYNLTTAKGPGVTGLFGLPGRLARYLVDPNVPLVPDLRTVSGTVSDQALKDLGVLPALASITPTTGGSPLPTPTPPPATSALPLAPPLPTGAMQA